MSTTSSSQTPAGYQWTTGLFDCASDEETCWWGWSAFWLVSARTTESFGLGSSLRQIIAFWVSISLAVFMIFIFGGLGLLFAILIFIGLAYHRAVIRSKIRAQYSLGGDFLDDVVKHTCCPCCAVCQEAREANERTTSVLDYCSGDRLLSPEGSQAIDAPASDNGVAVGDGFIAHLKTISKTSKIILVICSVVAAAAFVALFAVKRSRNAFVLLLTFFQPFVILYFVYWRARRRYAALDMVIKMFAVGFWFTTFQSVVLEEILQLVIMMVIGPFVATAAVAEGDDNGTDPSRTLSDSGSGVAMIKHLLVMFSRKHYYAQQVHLDGFEYVNQADSADTDEHNEDEDQSRKTMQKHIVVVIFSLFLMAFVVAAGVEETTKHFALRCCRLPAPLRDPHSILVYLMAAALGFATAENIEYVFGTSTSPIPGTSLFVGELFVLLIRVLMPVHVICSVLQAVNLSKVLLGHQQMPLYMIIMPAILLHGSFDFVLFLFGTLQFAYDINGSLMTVVSLLFPMIMSLVGALYAYFAFEKVQAEYNDGWQTFTDADDEESTYL